jgi:hypothetical protein
LISKESGQGTEFLKRLQEIEINEQQQENFNQEVDILDIYVCVARIAFTQQLTV